MKKARERARRIITIVTGLDYDEAGKLHRRALWNVKAPIVMQKKGRIGAQAHARLRQSNGPVRTAIGEDEEAKLRNLLGGRR